MKVFLQVLLVFAILMLGPTAWLNKNGLHVHRIIPPSSILLREGASYATELRFNPFFAGNSNNSDSGETPTRSKLKLTENGRELGPAHSLHAEIASKGGGRFSHWQNGLIFSSSDGSDPRSNHRVYRISYREYPTPTLYEAIAAGGALLALLIAALMQLKAIAVTGGQLSSDVHARANREAKPQKSLKTFLQAIASSLAPASLVHLAFLVFIYTITVLALYTAVLAEKTDSGVVKMNFEYRVF